MDVSDITPQLEKLDGDLDNLEEAIKPLLENMRDVTSKLPLLDKAKLYVLVAYAIETLLFCEISHIFTLAVC
jgi:exosome complex protein LRP1